MPFKSEAQRRLLWAKHPDIAEKWAHGEHSTSGSDHKMPSRSSVRKKHRGGRKSRSGAGRRGRR